MRPKITRKIVKIDEEKCDGCGICIPACAEGALKIINGKAKLVSEVYCDGLGACLGQCPRDAISIEERVAAEFDEEATKLYLEKESVAGSQPPQGCPSALMSLFNVTEEETGNSKAAGSDNTRFQWPVQLSLVPAGAPFFEGADILLAGDCTAFVYAGFHQEFARKMVILAACPKLDDFQAHLNKLAEIISKASLGSLTVLKIDVPCCSGLTLMAKRASQLAGKSMTVKEITISTKGRLMP